MLGNDIGVFFSFLAKSRSLEISFEKLSPVCKFKRSGATENRALGTKLSFFWINEAKPMLESFSASQSTRTLVLVLA